MTQTNFDKPHNKNQDFNYKKGDKILLTHGVYDDYAAKGLGVALKDFNAMAALHAWAHNHGEAGIYDLRDGVKLRKRNGHISFGKWLVENGFIEIIEYRELHLGAYLETFLSTANPTA